jgi:hypothetical protein
MKRYYIQFINPQTGDPDEIWFTTEVAQQQWLNDFREVGPHLPVVAHAPTETA